MSEHVAAGSLVTLHYSLSLEDGSEVASTFAMTPSTLQLGNGELADTLERCLIGMAPGERKVFLLEAEQAFGPRNPGLVQRIARSALPPGVEAKEGEFVEFTAPDGSRYAGMVRELSDTHALFDFNHPLAGRAVRFEVEIVGIL